MRQVTTKPAVTREVKVSCDFCQKVIGYTYNSNCMICKKDICYDCKHYLDLYMDYGGEYSSMERGVFCKDCHAEFAQSEQDLQEIDRQKEELEELKDQLLLERYKIIKEKAQQ